MQTLSFGFKKPQTPDKGSVFFPALEADIQQVNDHNHNGTNSAKLPASSLTPTQGSINSAGWVSLGGGNYRQLVTMPATLTIDDYLPHFRLSATGHPVLLSVEKVTATTYWVYINDNTQSLIVSYTA